MSHEKPNDTQKSLLIAALLILLVASGVAILTIFGVKHLHQAPVAEPILTVSKPAIVPGRDRKPTGLHPRMEWAKEWEQRMRDKGRTLSARAMDREFLTLELSWTEENVDQDHLRDLQNAPGFYQMLYKFGFEKLVMRVGKKEVWSKRIDGNLHAP